MAQISAASVMKLRKMSGQGMMDCKKALAETGGDIDEAMTLLRKKGMATLEKRAGRDTSEGTVICKVSDDGKTAAMATLCCETDFVAKSDDFLAAAELLGKYIDACEADEGADKLNGTEVDGKSFAEVITDTVSKTGEKTELGDYVRYASNGSGVIGTYVHFNNKIGAMVDIETDKQSTCDSLKQAAIDIAMHISATKPLALNPDAIDAKVIENERQIAAEQMKGKPENIIEKIVDGKMNKFFAENCLVSQPFVKDDKKTVQQALEDAAKACGAKATIKRFVRFEIG